MKVINTALLSFGMSGKVFHAPFLEAHHGFRLMGAWERSTNSIGSFYPQARSYQTIKELLNDSEVDLVVVNTPTGTHYNYAEQSLHAGKDVVVEKAFTTNAAEAIRLAELALSKGKKLSVYQNRRWDSDFLTVQSVIEQKLLGVVSEASISFERYNLELSPKLHKETPGPGSGNLLDLGPHCVDQALMLFGWPLSVFAEMGTFRPGSRVDDFFDILLSYPTLRVKLRSGYHFQDPGPGYVIRGSKGSFVKSRSDVQEAQLKSGMNPLDTGYGIDPGSENGTIKIEKGGHPKEEEVVSMPGNYMAFYNNLYDAILKDDRPLPVTAGEGIAVMKILDAARKSHESKSTVNI